MGCTTIKSNVNFANLNVYNSGLGSIQKELELINSIPVQFRYWSGNWN